jgi:hypothetical protein
MSNEYAIAAVTLTLRNLLENIKEIKNSDDLDQIPEDAKPSAEILVSNLPLDQAYESDKSKNHVNIFLYHVEHNEAWRNLPMPGKVKPGESGHPPLPLNLYYIITAYGENGKEIIGHLLLGKAMSILHDHALLGREELKDAFQFSAVHKQIERVRITPQPISLDEVSKLWSGFQTQYRLSAAYEVSVLLIESRRKKSTPLPVLTIGEDDKGVMVQPHLLPPYPALDSIVAPGEKTGAFAGDLLTLNGNYLQGDTVQVRFSHSQWEDPIDLAPQAGGTQQKLEVLLPDQWPAGLYRVTVLVTESGKERSTNQLPMLLLPQVTGKTFTPETPPPSNSYTASIDCKPQVFPDQDASLLLGNLEFPADPHTTQTGALTFSLTGVPDGDYYMRLRIDGVDSRLIDRTVTPPVFDSSQKVTLP